MRTEEMLYLERKYGLNGHRYQDFAYWTYGRFQVIRYLDNLKNGVPAKDARMKFSKNLLDNMCKLIWNGISKGCIPRKKVDICIFNHERRVQEGEYYECIYTERISERYKSSIVVECPYGLRHLQPVRTEKLFFCDRVLITSSIKAMVVKFLKLPAYQTIQNFLKTDLKEVLDEIERIEKVTLDRERFVSIFSYYYFLYRYRKNYWERLLKCISPKVIVEVVAYRMDCMIVNEIAKKLGIPTIELQHGTMGKGHIAYNYNKGEFIPQFPDRVLLFSDYWRQCTQFPIPEINTPAVGYPYFENKMQKYLPLKNNREKQRRKTVLFISQWIIGAALSEFAVALYQKMKDDDVRFIYKLHPGEYNGWKKNYPVLAESGIEVIDTLEHNVYEYFAISDIQIGVFSTAIYEGLGFGLETYIYQTHFSDNMKELCDAGFARMVKDVDELCYYLREDRIKGTIPPEQFWKKNSLENIYMEIDSVLKERR